MEVTELCTSLDELQNKLLKALVVCNDRIEIGKRNEAMASVVDRDILDLTTQLNDLKASVNYASRIYKNASRYLEIREAQSLGDLRDAVKKASKIVPSSDLEDVDIEYKNKKASIVNNKKQNVNIREGSAVQVVSSMLMRYVMLMYDPGAIKVVFMDEHFNTLSEETSNAMKEELEQFSKSLAFVCIEQYSTLFNGLVTKEYLAEKRGKITTITEVS